MTWRRRLARATAVVFVISLAWASPVRGEGFFDLFAGGAWTVSNDVEARSDDGRDVLRSDFKHSLSVGGRAGYWWRLLGVGLDVSYFRPEFDPDDTQNFAVKTTTDLDVVAIGLQGMVRGQFLKPAGARAGSLQPYAFAGPTLFISQFAFEIIGRRRAAGSDVSSRVGLTAGTGVTWMINDRVGVFAEYRFARNRPEFELRGFTLAPKLDSHHVLAGLTIRL